MLRIKEEEEIEEKKEVKRVNILKKKMYAMEDEEEDEEDELFDDRDTDDDKDEEVEGKIIVEAPISPNLSPGREEVIGPIEHRQLIHIDEEGEVIKLKPYIKDSKSDLSRCDKEQRKSKWIGKTIKHVWISTPEGMEKPVNYMIDFTVEKNGKIWNKANIKFFKLNCNSRRKDRKQEDTTLILHEEDGTPVYFMVAYETDNGDFIIQDEGLFEKENTYFRNKNVTIDSRINFLLSQPISQTVISTGLSIIKQNLTGIVDNVDNYAEKVATSVYNASIGKNTKDYFRIIANIFVYFIPVIKNKFGKLIETEYKQFQREPILFIKRLKEHYYLPEILIDLSPDEKLPEVFDDHRVPISDKNRISEIITYNIEKLVHKYGYMVYRHMEPGKRMTRPELTEFIGEVDLPENRNELCINVEDVATLGEEDFVVYYDDQNYYCIPILDLVEKFDYGDYTNPYTNEPLSKEFIKKFNNFTKPVIVQEHIKEKEKILKLKSLVPELALGLFDVVRGDIYQMTGELFDIEEQEEDEEDEQEEGEGEFIDEEIDSGGEVDDDLDIEFDDNLEKLEAAVSNIGYNESEQDASEQCYYCRKKIDINSAHKTIIQDENGKIHVIYFCSLSCMEDQEHWPKPKKKKKKGKKSKK